MVAFALYRYALRVNAAADEVEELKRRLEDLDSAASRAAAAEALERLRTKAATVVADGRDGASCAAVVSPATNEPEEG